MSTKLPSALTDKPFVDATFVRIAADVGCDEKTVRTLASQHIEHVDGGYPPKLPEWLGLDETKIDGKQRLVITDIGDRRPVEMLDNQKSRYFVHFVD